MLQQLLVATSNPGKQSELHRLLSGLGWETVTPKDLGISLSDLEENEDYQENAIMKAQIAASRSGLVALADDSGLEVDALEGAPGPLSARYGGEGLSDGDRVRLLLSQIQEAPRNLRKARFRCVIAVARPGGEVWTCEDVVEGDIAYEPRGEGGFGYDPIFRPSGSKLTMAELPAEKKDDLSHRGRALRRAWPLLRRLALDEV